MNEIVNGRRNITPESALSIGEALGTGTEFWLNLQRDCDLWHAVRRHTKVPKLQEVSYLKRGPALLVRQARC